MRACSQKCLLLFLYRATPVTEMKRSVIEVSAQGVRTEKIRKEATPVTEMKRSAIEVSAYFWSFVVTL